MEDGSVLIRIEAEDAPLRAALEGVAQLADAAAGQANAAFLAAGQALSQALSVSGALSALAPGLVAGFASCVEQAGQAQLPASGEALLQALASGLAAGEAALTGQARKTASAAASAAGSAGDLFRSAGQSLAEGLWQGVQSRTGWLQAQLSGWAQGLSASVRAAFGIHSPSTVMAEIGRNLALGLGEGWLSQAPQVLSDIERSASSLPAAMLALQPLAAAESSAAAALTRSASERWQNAAVQQQASRAAASSATNVQTNIEFRGSLAQLGRVLQPVISQETRRAGRALTDGRE